MSTIPSRTSDLSGRDGRVLTWLKKIAELERETVPQLGPVPGKDEKAFTALRVMGVAARALTGWAMDHVTGLALEGFQQSGKFSRPGDVQTLTLQDDHGFEDRGHACSEDLAGQMDPTLARRLLIAFVHTNAGGMPPALQRMTMDALQALEYGEVLPIFKPARDKRKKGLTKLRAQLTALAIIEHRKALGEKAEDVRREVADAYGVNDETVRNWRIRLRKGSGGAEGLGETRVAAELQRARDWARYAISARERLRLGDYEINDEIDDPGHGDRFLLTRADADYGAAALAAAAQRYNDDPRRLARGAKRPTLSTDTPDE